MRILHVTECWSTGVARAILGLLHEAPEHEHHLLYTGFEKPPAEATFLTRTELPVGHMKRVAALRRHTIALRPDIVHLHSSWAGVYGRVVRLPATRVVYQPHCFAFEDTTRPVLHRAIFSSAERFLGRNTDVVATVSERERFLGHRMAPKARVVLVPNRSDLRYVESRPPQTETARRVVMSGEIRNQKDPELFAAIARAARGLDLDLDFVWLGDGDSTQRKLLEESGVDVAGWVSKQRVSDELDRAALYLHTAKFEGFPLSVLDAAARRVPLLVRRSPAFEGLGLKMFNTAEEAVSILSDAAALAENSASIRRHFNPDNLRPAVRRLYEGQCA